MSHLKIVGGTDYPAAMPAGKPRPCVAPVELDRARALVLAAKLRDGRPVRAVLEHMRQSSRDGSKFGDYTDTLMTLMRAGIHAYLPDATLPVVFARVDDPRKLIRALGLRSQLKPEQLVGLVLCDEHRAELGEL